MLLVLMRLLTGSVANADLANSSLTIGSTSVSLGATATTFTGLTSVSSTDFVGALTGNASTATTLATARTIGGVSFDGSADIDLPGVNTAGNQNTSGNAATATTLATPRDFSATGDATATAVSFDGSGNVALALSLATNSVGSDEIAASAVGTSEIATDAVDSDEIATDAVGSDEIADGSVANADLANSSLTIGSTSVSLGATATTFTGLTSVSSTDFVGALTGNASTATTLATARTIGGVSFDGSADIDLPGVNTAGNQNTSGNAATATTLATPRDFSATGDATATAVSFDGSGNVALALSLATNSVDSDEIVASAVGTSEIADGSVANVDLQNDNLTIGTTNIVLGATATELRALDRVDSDGLMLNPLTATETFDANVAFEVQDDAGGTAMKVNTLTGQTTLSSLYVVGTTTWFGDMDVTGDISTNGIVSSADQPTDDNHLTTKLYVDGLDAANVKLTGDQTIAGVKTFTSAIVGDLTGNASTATTLETPRDFSATGDATATAVSFDGSGNVALALSLATNSVDSDEIATDAVDSDEIATDAVGSDEIADGSVANADLANSSLTIGSTSVSLGATATTFTGLTSVSSTDFVGALTGNASTATTLATARTIGGVSFDGSADIDLPGVNTAGNQNTSGNAATATTLATPRNFSATGDATATAVPFDGSGNVALALSLATNSVDSDAIAASAVESDEIATDAVGSDEIADGSVANTDLANSSLTIGSTSVSLGATATTFTGLTSVSSTNFVGALTGNASTATTLATARTIGGVSFDGSADIDLPGVNTAGNQNTSGNAATVTNGRYTTDAQVFDYTVTSNQSNPVDVGTNYAYYLNGANVFYQHVTAGDADLNAGNGYEFTLVGTNLPTSITLYLRGQANVIAVTADKFSLTYDNVVAMNGASGQTSGGMVLNLVVDGMHTGVQFHFHLDDTSTAPNSSF